MPRREITMSVAGGLIAGVGLLGLAWEYLWHNVPGKKDLERVIKEVYW